MKRWAEATAARFSGGKFFAEKPQKQTQKFSNQLIFKIFKKMKKSLLYIFAVLAIGLLGASQMNAQATLSTQGVLQKTTGMAVEDGDYAITFKLYTTESGGTPVWSETQDPVEVVGGVYGVQLGSVNPLNIPFDQVYYLGLTVGTGTEHFPRTKLTAAPYALSLLGQDNKFPSTGNVGIGTNTPTAKLQVEGSTVLKGSISTATVITGADDYTVAATDHVIYLDGGFNQNVILPAATAANAGRKLTLLNRSGSAKTSSNYQDLDANFSTLIPAHSVIDLQSDGSIWRHTGGYVQSGGPKAYVFCQPTSNQNLGPANYHLINYTEVSDAQNAFSNNNTFTAPRTGIYRVSGSYVMNGNWSNSAQMGVTCFGTCAMGVANQIIGFSQAGPGINQNTGLSFGADVQMNAGQTLRLALSQNSGNIQVLFGGINGHLTITEQ